MAKTIAQMKQQLDALEQNMQVDELVEQTKLYASMVRAGTLRGKARMLFRQSLEAREAALKGTPHETRVERAHIEG